MGGYCSHPVHRFRGSKGLPAPAFRMAFKCLLIPLPMDPRRRRP